jgi:hypothetical protein
MNRRALVELGIALHTCSGVSDEGHLTQAKTRNITHGSANSRNSHHYTYSGCRTDGLPEDGRIPQLVALK